MTTRDKMPAWIVDPSHFQYEVLAIDAGDTAVDAVGTYAGADLAVGILDLCSQWRERHANDFTVSELDDTLASALRFVVKNERDWR